MLQQEQGRQQAASYSCVPIQLVVCLYTHTRSSTYLHNSHLLARLTFARTSSSTYLVRPSKQGNHKNTTQTDVRVYSLAINTAVDNCWPPLLPVLYVSPSFLPCLAFVVPFLDLARSSPVGMPASMHAHGFKLLGYTYCCDVCAVVNEFETKTNKLGQGHGIMHCTHAYAYELLQLYIRP